ncbi:MAG: TolC family protein, partial [Zetaproteobacteria bacterium]|nr:TolC family protein [Zetaproteobacteria bacterium]
MKRISVIMLMFIALNIFSQEKLSLEQCYTLAEKNYPLAKQNDLLLKQNTIDLEIINIEKLPKLDFLVQASYQSDVTSLPFSIPVTTVEPPNKDQYKATVSINQLIYDGGFINASLTEKSTSLKTQQKQVEVNLYRLKEQVNQFYFSILLLQEKSALLLAKKKQLETTLNEVKAGIKFGVLLPNSDSILQAELLKIDQQLMEVGLNKTSLMTTLYMLIGIPVSQNIIFDNPEINTKLNHEIERPELELFQLQKENIDASEQLIDKKNSPKLSGFATGGYGNPGLNMLDNSFQTYYIAGIKLNWNVFDWNSTKKQRQSLQVNKEIIDSEQEVFELNTAMELTQQQS